MKNLKLLFAAMATFFIGSFIGQNFGLNPMMSGTALVGANLLMPSQKGIAMTAVGFNLSDLAAQLGPYFRKVNQKMSVQIFQGTELEKYMTPVAGVKDQYVSTAATMSDILQPYQCDWTPQGEASFRARINNVDQIKADIDIKCIDSLFKTYLGELAQEGKTRTQWPFVKYFVDKLMIPKMIEEIDAISFHGVKNAPIAGTASPYLDSTDGIGTIITNEITAGNITPINTGAITASNIVDRVEFFADNIPSKYKKQEGYILMSSVNATKYFRDFRANFGANNNYDGNKGMYIEGTSLKIIGISTMDGSDRFIYTPKSNMLKMFDTINFPKGVEVQLNKRVLHILTDFKRGYGFEDLNKVFANDQV